MQSIKTTPALFININTFSTCRGC